VKRLRGAIFIDWKWERDYSRCKCGIKKEDFISIEILPKKEGYYLAEGMSENWDGADCHCLYIYFDGKKFHSESNIEVEGHWGDMVSLWSAYDYIPSSYTKTPDENITYRPEDEL